MTEEQVKRISEYYCKRAESKNRLSKSLSYLDAEKEIPKNFNTILQDDDPINVILNQNLIAWSQTIFICLQEIRYSILEALTSFEMSETYDQTYKKYNLWRFCFEHDNAVFRLFACRDKIIHLLITLYGYDRNQLSKETLGENALKKIYKKFNYKKERNKILNEITTKKQNCEYFNYIDKLDTKLTDYKSYRNSKIHKQEPAIRIDDNKLLHSLIWITSEKTDFGDQITLGGTSNLYKCNELKNKIVEAYEGIISIVKDLFYKLKA